MVELLKQAVLLLTSAVEPLTMEMAETAVQSSF